MRLAISVKHSARSKPARISSRSPSDRRAAEGFHAVAPRATGSRVSTLLTACLDPLCQAAVRHPSPNN